MTIDLPISSSGSWEDTLRQHHIHSFTHSIKQSTSAVIALATIVSSLWFAPHQASATPSLQPTPSSTQSVIVAASPGALATVTQKLRTHGATVTRSLPIINAVAVEVRVGRLDDISSLPGVTTVVPDGVLSRLEPAPFATDQSKKNDAKKDGSDNGSDNGSDDGTGDPQSSRDAGSVESIARVTGARSLWDKGITGRGVDVALIDTGVTPVPGTPTTVTGADLSSDAANPNLRFLDGYGHGTHMAGIIAGRDASVSDPRKARGRFVGIAPDSRIVNVKVGSMDGSVHTSQVVAALDWVVQNRTQNGMNIKVINLSYGSPATTDWQRDPLAWAAEVAWRKGVMVVAAAGNDGAGHELGSPAYSPHVLAVGATEVETGRNGRNDYVISPFTSTGTRRRPDLYVPGSHVASLRVKGSFIDTLLARAVVNDQLTRGSGTSQATAVTSGLAALLYQAYPAATPDQIKALLTGTVNGNRATRDALTGIEANVNVRDAWKAGRKELPLVVVSDPFAGCGAQWCRGIGDGSQSLTDWAQASWTGSSWTGSSWTGSSWTGSSWTGSSWTGNQWSGSSWTGSSWTGSQWTGSQWTGSQWTGSQWSGSYWTGNQWTGSSWTGSSWTGSSWTGSSWTGSAWSSTWNE